LAACNQEAPADDVVADEAPAEAAAPAVGGPGTYEVTYADGTVGTMTRAEDGTFTAKRGEESATGKVTEADGKACFDVDGDEEGPRCWTAGEVAEDGSWTATADDGEVVTVKPVTS